MEQLIALARDAGHRIMEVYETDFEVGAKDDHSPLTDADMAAHRTIVAGLAAIDPDTPVLSEESADIPWPVRRRWSRYWLVDPLDGTREFVKRNGEFTVNIALVEDGVPVRGVVHVPVTGVTYWAEQGNGAFRDGERIRTRATAPDKPVIAASRSHAGGSLKAFLDALGDHELASIGSSLKFCLVAEGRADFYPRLGPTSEWDTAAAQCVVEAAGGAVTTLDGEPLRYNTKESLLNPWFAVSADRGLPWLPLLRASLDR